jgi:hypothetical protein
VRVIDAFDWYASPYQSYFREEELISWFKEAGFRSIQVSPHGFLPVGITITGIKE